MQATTQSLVIAGSGFAGVWAALAAARQRRALGLDEQIAIRVISPNSYLGIRPRFYEADLADTTVELDRLFAPVGIEHLRDRVIGVDPARRTIDLGGSAGPGGRTVRYDALVWALGSATVLPSLPGAERLHSVDTLPEATALDRHLRALAADPDGGAAAATAVVVGAGFSGLEVASELTGRLRRLFPDRTPRVVLVERTDRIAPDYGPDARAVIASALAALGVEVRTGASVAELTDSAATLTTGEAIAARTVVWTAGFAAPAATRWIGPPADAGGRLAVDVELRVAGHDAIWAAGDVAHAMVDDTRAAVMSCQHAGPQGRYAGHNALRWLAGRSGKRYQQGLYLTCLDLGAWGALLTCGFERNRILAAGPEAKPIKQFINTQAIYPPLDGDPRALLRAAAPPPGGPLVSAIARWAVARRWIRDRITRRARRGQPAELVPATR